MSIDHAIVKSSRLKKGEKTIEQLKAMKDKDIDYSDIPELTEEFWKNAVLVKPVKKKSITLRVDEDTISFYKKSIGKGYQTFMNNVLSTYANSHRNQ